MRPRPTSPPFARPTPPQSADLQRAAVAAFPSITAIDLALVMETLDGIFDKVAWVIEFMASFTVATGLIVLAGAVISGRYQRRREMVLLRTLGASHRQLVQIPVCGARRARRAGRPGRCRAGGHGQRIARPPGFSFPGRRASAHLAWLRSFAADGWSPCSPCWLADRGLA